MKKLFYLALTFILISFQFTYKLYALESEAGLDKSQTIIINKYAERFCNAKADNFFEGLDNEKTLKYSYFKYIGFKNKEIFSKKYYNILIKEIKEKCDIKKEEEDDINRFYKLNEN